VTSAPLGEFAMLRWTLLSNKQRLLLIGSSFLVIPVGVAGGVWLREALRNFAPSGGIAWTRPRHVNVSVDPPGRPTSHFDDPPDRKATLMREIDSLEASRTTVLERMAEIDQRRKPRD